jgi:hypothetical protein
MGAGSYDLANLAKSGLCSGDGFSGEWAVSGISIKL